MRESVLALTQIKRIGGFQDKQHGVGSAISAAFGQCREGGAFMPLSQRVLRAMALIQVNAWNGRRR